MRTVYSIIIPSHNEERSLPLLIPRLIKVFNKIKEGYELIVIDDGSSDNTLAVLKEQVKEKKLTNIQIYHLRRNLGKSAAYYLGFKKAKGEFCVTIDADLQDIPEEIPKLIEKTREKFDVVVGWRKRRIDSWPKRFESWMWNRMINIFSGAKLHDVNSGLKIIRKRTLTNLSLHGEFHRYLPIILYLEGYRVAEVPVKHSKRFFGRSRYSFRRVIYAFFDFFTTIFIGRFGQRPMYFFGNVGGIVFFLGMLINFYLVIIKLQGHAIGGRPLLILGVLLTISGIQLTMTGFLGDLVISHGKTSIDAYPWDKIN